MHEDWLLGPQYSCITDSTIYIPHIIFPFSLYDLTSSSLIISCDVTLHNLYIYCTHCWLESVCWIILHGRSGGMANICLETPEAFNFRTELTHHSSYFFDPLRWYWWRWVCYQHLLPYNTCTWVYSRVDFCFLCREPRPFWTVQTRTFTLPNRVLSSQTKT